MSFQHYTVFILFLLIFSSCEQRLTKEEEKEVTVCSSPNFSVSKEDNIVIPDTNTPVVWEGSYTDESVKISFTRGLGLDKETETFAFIFDKVEECLRINRGYEYYFGSYAGISAITEVNILELEVSEWILNKKLTGRIAYIDHHNKEIYNRNFWIEFTENDYEIKNTDYNFFPKCFSEKLPIDIDLDEDGVIDYKMVAEQKQNTGNKPNFTSYTIKLISTDESVNEILSPKNTKPPFPVIFEPPLSSKNTRKYDANRFNSVDVRNSLDVFYEFETPYESFNFFLNNNLTNRKEFLNNKEDYYLIRLFRDNNYFYGWIKIDFNALDCKLEILDTFLSQSPNEHIFVD